jgi:hypothetical protein
MTSSQACPPNKNCAGPHRTRWKNVGRVVTYTLLVLPIVVGQGLAQGSLQGRYSNDGLSITFLKDRASVFYGGRLCIGDFEGQVEKRSDGFFVVGRDCEIALTLQADGGLNLQQGPGCSAWHGARCSLSGLVYPDR